MTSSDKKVSSPKCVDKMTFPDSDVSRTNASKPKEAPAKRPYDWLLLLYFLYLHLLTPYAIYLVFTEAKLMTTIFILAMVAITTLGITAGSHRLWAHRTYKANKTLRILLMILQTCSGHGNIYNWVLQHRKHHKYLGTNDDPFNINRGFIYTHIMSNMEKMTPTDEAKAKEIDMSDLEEDGIVMFQKKYYWYLHFFISILLPVNAPMEYWDEGTTNSVFIAGILVHTLCLHAAWLVHSAILVWGLQPDDKYPADTNLVFLITKSYWPQYHHLTPWDYQCGEFGNYGDGFATTFLRVCAALGWATELRTIDSNSVKKAVTASLNSDIPIEKCLEVEGEAHVRALQNHYLYRNLC